MDNIDYEMEALDNIIKRIDKELDYNQGFSGYVAGIDFVRDMLKDRYEFLEDLRKSKLKDKEQ